MAHATEKSWLPRRLDLASQKRYQGLASPSVSLNPTPVLVLLLDTLSSSFGRKQSSSSFIPRHIHSKEHLPVSPEPEKIAVAKAMCCSDWLRVGPVLCLELGLGVGKSYNLK